VERVERQRWGVGEADGDEAEEGRGLGVSLNREMGPPFVFLLFPFIFITINVILFCIIICFILSQDKLQY